MDDFDTLGAYIVRYREARRGGAQSATLTQSSDGTPTHYGVDWDTDTVDDEHYTVFTDVVIDEPSRAVVPD